MFEAFVSDLSGRGIVVEIVLTPYHPIVYEAIVNSEQYQTVLRVEDYMKAFARREGVPLYGSYDPYIYECGPAEFYDGLHPKESCLTRLWN